jgi:hypothetical protein
MTYQLTNIDAIKKTEDNGIIKWIPSDPTNSDWAEYQAWLAADPENQPLPADS